jgi:hypothetical protein
MNMRRCIRHHFHHLEKAWNGCFLQAVNMLDQSQWAIKFEANTRMLYETGGRYR